MAQIAVADLHSKPEGLLTIATTSGVSTRFLVAHLDKFCEEYPSLRLKILNSDLAANFASQEVDTIIVPLQSVPQGYSGEYLTTFTFALFAAQEYVQNFGLPNTPEDLNEHRLIAYGDHPHHYQQSDWFLSLGLAEAEVRGANIAINSRAGILQIVKQGAGITALDQYVGEAAGLVRVLPQIKGPEVDVYYAYPHCLKNSSKVRAMGNFLKKVARLENRKAGKSEPGAKPALKLAGS